jgi:hypothetical protein
MSICIDRRHDARERRRDRIVDLVQPIELKC